MSGADRTRMLGRRGALGAAAGAACAITTARAPGARQPSPAPSGRAAFAVEGNSLTWAGKPVRLLGVAMGDPIYVRKDRPPSDYTTVARTWSCNTVRICVHPGHWAADRAATARALQVDVGEARKAGLFVIIDWKAIGFPDRYVEKPEPSWGLPENAYASDFALAAGFWQQMAEDFGQDPGILFELWNEPTVDPKVWVSTGRHWPLMKSLWLRLIEIVRRRSGNIVLVAGGQWAHDLMGVADSPIDDPAVAYAWHCYPPTGKNIPHGWHRSLGGVPAMKPVIVTEWGFCRTCGSHIRGTAESFGTPFVNHILEPLMLGSTAWCWSPGAAPQMLHWDWETPTEFGAFVQDHLSRARRPQRVPA